MGIARVEEDQIAWGRQRRLGSSRKERDVSARGGPSALAHVVSRGRAEGLRRRKFDVWQNKEPV